MKTGSPISKKSVSRPATRLLGLFAVGVLLLAAVPPHAQAATTLPPLGMSMDAVDDLKRAGAAPRYGSYWVGEWISSSGWAGVENALKTAKAEGVTPVLFWYYWADQISPDCVEYGCDSRSRSEWTSMTNTLASKIQTIMGGAEVIVVLENEFNKGGITGTYAPKFDGYLEGVAKQLQAVPGVKLVLGFGAWGENDWTKFPKSAAQSDYIGFQMMRASTKDTETQYRAASDRIQYFTDFISAKFNKPAFLYDLALSSYPDAHWEKLQAEELKDVFDILHQAGANGLKGVVYRTLYDNPNMGLHNYYGYAERHWGLKKAYNGGDKPAWAVWKAEATGTSSGTPTTTTFDATFSGVKVDEWWVQTSVSANKGVSKVEARIDGGAWQSLENKGWGYAKSVNVKAGQCVDFRATATDGSTDLSSKTCRAGAVAFDATFSGVKVDEWWVQASVSGNKAIAKVEARVDGGAWQALTKQSWGAYAKSINVKAGQCVDFRATATDGATDLSEKTCRAGTAAFDATFSGVKVDEWWVQASVKGNKPLAKVEARVNGGSWILLEDKGWGYAKSVNVKTGQSVEFRATATDGTTDVSAKYSR
jgi:hypothetical protein